MTLLSTRRSALLVGPQGIQGEQGPPGPPGIPILGQIDGNALQEYSGAGDKLYVSATETKLGATSTTDGGPVLDSFVNTLVGNSGVIAKIGLHGNGQNLNGKGSCDVSISVFGVDTGWTGDFWRGDLIFTGYFNLGTVTMYNAAGSQTTINGQGVRKNGSHGTAYTATATISGNQIFINVSGTAAGVAPIKWQCIGQLQWLQ